MRHTFILGFTMLLSCFSLISYGSAVNQPNNVASIKTEKSPTYLYDREDLHLSTKRIFGILTRSHFVTTTIDDTFSTQVFDQLLYQLDPDKIWLSREDITTVNKFRLSFDEMFLKADLTAAATMLNQLLTIVDHKLNIAIQQAQQKSTNHLTIHRPRQYAQAASTTTEQIQRINEQVNNALAIMNVITNNNSASQTIIIQRYQHLQQHFANLKPIAKYDLIINAFINAFEPTSRYLPPIDRDKSYNSVNLPKATDIKTSVGIRLSNQLNQLVIDKIFANTSAAQSQLSVGDMVIGYSEQDGKFIDLSKLTPQKAIKKIDGTKPSVIYLTVLSNNKDNSKPPVVKKIKLIRNPFSVSQLKITDVIAKTPTGEPRVGIITIPSLYTGVSKDIAAALKRLKQKNVDSIMLDLRDNGGGSLIESIRLAGMFINTGPILLIKDHKGKVFVESDRDDFSHYHGPLTILVNEQTASGSEIIAATLQDYGRAVIIGQPTYGQGTIQKHQGLSRIYDTFNSPMGSLQYTIAKFYRINGASIHKTGITPDISLKNTNYDWLEYQDNQPNSLPSDTVNPQKYQPLQDLTKVLKWLNCNLQSKEQLTDVEQIAINITSDLTKGIKNTIKTCEFKQKTE